MAIILSITGSDGTGGSGIQADIKTISVLGGRAVSAITSVTLQNTLGIQAFYDLPADIVRGQIEAIINDIQPDTVRVGMIRNAETLAVVVEALQRYRPRFVIYDPIVTASNGEVLLPADVIALVRRRLLPLCNVVVLRKEDKDKILLNDMNANVRVVLMENPRIHGSANSFSSALAVFLNKEKTVDEAIQRANEYVSKLVTHTSDLNGRSNQLYNEFVSMLEAHYSTNRDVAFYAECLNVSPTYLSQVTHKVSGHSPKSIIDKILTEAIMNRLKSSVLSIQEVALAFNFCSQAQFTKFFKKQTGLTPSEYRKSEQ